MYFWGKHIDSLEESSEEKNVRICTEEEKKDRRERGSFIRIIDTISFYIYSEKKRNSGKMI